MPPLADLAVFPYDPPLVATVIFALFFMFLGGSIGSFLNVVIYRVPAGLSIVKPRSRCPKCLTPILTRDNVPVVGWLVLRGRCRACREPISMRYPTVEFIAGAIFTALAFGELVYPGIILPIAHEMAEYYPLAQTLVYHFALLCGLGAAAMIVYDRAIVPPRFWRLLFIIGFVPPLVWPAIRPLPPNGSRRFWAPLEYFREPFAFDHIVAAAFDGFFGLALGALCGVAAWPASSHLARGRSGHLDAVAMFGCIGLFLGWQAVAGIALIASAAWAVRQVFYCLGSKPRAPWQAYPAAAALVWILCWRVILNNTIISDPYSEGEIAHVIGDLGRSLFGSRAPYWLAPAALTLTFALSLAARKLAETAGRQSHATAAEPHP